MYQYKEIYRIDFTEISSCYELSELIRETFDFPEWYSHGEYAFWDCMTDLIGEHFLNIEIVGIEKAKKSLANIPSELLDILRRVKHYDNDRYIDTIRIVIVREDGTREELA